MLEFSVASLSDERYKSQAKKIKNKKIMLGLIFFCYILESEKIHSYLPELNLIQGKTLFQKMKRNIHEFCCVPCVIYKELVFCQQPERQAASSCFQLGTLRISHPHSQPSYPREWKVVLVFKTLRVQDKAKCVRNTFSVHVMYEKINVQNYCPEDLKVFYL